MPTKTVLALSAAFLVFLAAGGNAAAQAPKQKQRQQPNRKQPAPNPIYIGSLELGQAGYLVMTPQPGRQPVLLPLKAEDIDEGQFIGSLTSSMTGKRYAVIVRGVQTKGMVSGRYFQMEGELKVTDTEDISSGETVFVLEPTNPEQFAVKRSDSPDLMRPR